MKKLWDLLCSYNTIVKLIGRLVIFVCLILLLTEVFGNSLTNNVMGSLPWAFIITGTVIYVIGWIAGLFEKRREKSHDTSDEL